MDGWMDGVEEWTSDQFLSSSFSSENDRKVHHTYSFQSEKCKLDWLNNLRYAKLKLSKFHAAK